MANSYLTRTVSSAGNRKTFTISAWVKRSKLSYDFSYMVTAGQYQTDQMAQFKFDANDNLNISGYASNGSKDFRVNTNRRFRDVNAWYHVMAAVDTTQATASNRVKLYVNGVQETSFEEATYPSQNYDTAFNSAVDSLVGLRKGTSTYFEGYLSHVAIVDGAALAPTSFGETDSTSGIWKFKSPSGLSWGTNGVHLKFENSGNLGLDSSGQTNNYTVNGNLRQALDTPSNVYCTMNPLDNQNQGSTFTIGNNKIEYNTNNKTNFATFAVNEGKWYWEMKFANNTGGNDAMIGVVKEIDRDGSDWVGHDAIGWSYYASNGSKYTGGSGSSYGNSWTTNDIIGIAFDADTRTLWFSKNGVWQNSATISEIAAGTTTNSAFSGIGSAGEYFFPAMSGYDGNKVEFNFGNGYFSTTAISSAGSNGNGSLFEYDVPSGFYALNTKNINTYG